MQYFEGNAAYGRCLLNAEGFKRISYTPAQDEVEISRRVNDKRFYELTELGDHTVEMQHLRPQTIADSPVHVGFFVLEYAKLLLLRFYYDFLTVFLDDKSFCLISSDTDSLYMGLSEHTFYEAVKPSMRGDYMKAHDQWIAREYCDHHKSKYFVKVFAGKKWKPKECCQLVAKYYSRQAGLFHVENVSQGVVALCPKSYYCYGHSEKVSAKGVKKKQNALTETLFKDVLFGQKVSQVKNRGFKKRDGKIYTYVQTRKGLNYLYTKRIVDPDHVTTHPTSL